LLYRDVIMKDEEKSKKQLLDELKELRAQLNKPVASLPENEPVILEEHLNEALFRSLVESMPQNVFSKDLEGRFTFANRQYCITEKRSLADIIGKTDFDLHPADMAKKYQHDDLQVMQSRQTVNITETHPAPDGSILFVQVIKTPVFDSRGNVKGMLGMFWDITKEKRVEEERFKIEKLESVGILAGGIAHDFNNLLTGLFGNLELAKIHLDQEHKAYQHVHSASRLMKNLTKLTMQLLTFAKGGDPVKENITVDELISETATFSMRGSNVKLIIDIEEDLYPVSADKGQLSQVISNLVINAQQAMPNGGNITIAAANREKGGKQYIKIDVQDQGTGITQQNMDKIFDPYFTTKEQGSGLGLATTHSIIKKHSGTIKVTSSSSTGTCFTIYLPAIDPRELPSTDTQTDLAAAGACRVAKVLIMDDEQDIVSLLKMMLTEMGHRVVSTQDGKEAARQYQQSLHDQDSFDLVILDLTVPGAMGGKGAAREILEMDEDALLVVSSGYATDDIMSRYREYGFKAQIAKPYSFIELKNTITRLLQPQLGD